MLYVWFVSAMPSDWLERFIPEMTYYVLSGTLTHCHSGGKCELCCQLVTSTVLQHVSLCREVMMTLLACDILQRVLMWL